MWDPKRIADPAWFLDRADERKRLRALIERRDDVLIYGQRRLGKTSLIRRVAEDLPEIAFLLVDCNFADTEEELSRYVLDRLRSTRLARARQFVRWVRAAVERLEIGVELRGDSVAPFVRAGSPRSQPLDDTLEFVTRISRAAKTQIVLVFDEFQNVMEGSHSIIAKLRDHAQRQRDVTYLVAGSQPSVLLSLTRHRSPFWRQLTEFRVGRIDVDSAVADVARLTRAVIPDESRAELKAVTAGNTQRLVEILAAAWGGRRRFALLEIRKATEVVAGRHEASFERILGQLTAIQRRVAIALATDRPAHPTGAAFLKRAGVGPASRIQKAMAGLRAAEVLDEEGDFVDPLLAWWIRRGTAGETPDALRGP